MFGVLKAFQLFPVRSILICLGAILTALPSAADTVTQRVQGWELTTSTNPISDVSSYWISRASVDGDIELALKCDSEGASPYLFFILGRKPELIGLDDVSGTLRIDTDEPVSVEVFGDHRSAQVSSSGLAKISDKLKSGSRLAFELNYSNVSEVLSCASSSSLLLAGLCKAEKSKVSGTVSLSGSTKAIDWLVGNCGSLPEPEVITPPNEVEDSLAQTLKADAEAGLKVALGKERKETLFRLAGDIRIQNSTSYYYCSNSVAGYFSRGEPPAMEFYQKGIKIGGTAGSSFSIKEFETVKDEVGLDTKCVVAPNSVRKIGFVELPDGTTPDALLLKQEHGLETEDFSKPATYSWNEPTTYIALKIEEVRATNAGFYHLERIRDEYGRYTYKHTPVDWNQEAKKVLEGGAPDPVQTNPAQPNPA